MQRRTDLLALLGAALLALAIYVPASSASAGTITTSYSVGVSCTAPFSEVCNPPATVTVHTAGVLQADFFHPAECSPIAVNLIVDVVTEFTSPFLLNQDTGFIELGPVQPGSHVIGVQAIRL